MGRNESVVVDTFQVRCRYHHPLCQASLCVNRLSRFPPCCQYQGQYRTALRCPGCGHESPVFETFQYLSLPIPTVLEELTIRVVPYLNPAEYEY